MNQQGFPLSKVGCSLFKSLLALHEAFFGGCQLDATMLHLRFLALAVRLGFGPAFILGATEDSLCFDAGRPYLLLGRHGLDSVTTTQDHEYCDQQAYNGRPDADCNGNTWFHALSFPGPETGRAEPYQPGTHTELSTNYGASTHRTAVPPPPHHLSRAP